MKRSTQPQLSPTEIEKINWRISSRSTNAGGQCVEAGPLTDGSGRVAVRHSQHPEGSIVVYTKDEWAAFLAGVRNGEFDFRDLSPSRKFFDLVGIG